MKMMKTIRWTTKISKSRCKLEFELFLFVKDVHTVQVLWLPMQNRNEKPNMHDFECISLPNLHVLKKYLWLWYRHKTCTCSKTMTLISKVHETCIYTNKQQHSMLFASALRIVCWYHLTKSLTQYSNLPWRCHSFVLKDGPPEAEDYINTQVVVWLRPFLLKTKMHITKNQSCPSFSEWMYEICQGWWACNECPSKNKSVWKMPCFLLFLFS